MTNLEFYKDEIYEIQRIKFVHAYGVGLAFS